MLSCVFLCFLGAVSRCQSFVSDWGRQLQKHTEMLEAVHGNKAVMCTSLNGLKDSEKNVRTLMFKECMATSFATSHELVARDLQMTPILIVDQLHINQETFHQILLEGLKKRKSCTQFFLLSLTHEQQKLRVIIRDSLGYFSVAVKENVRPRSGEPSHHQGPERFT